MPTNTEPCPVPGCLIRKSRQYLMCRVHWARVPRDLQGAVYGAYRAWRGDRISLDELRDVQADAIAAAAA